MTTENMASSSGKSAHKAGKRKKSVSAERQKQGISPAERWLLISEKVYARAQKRGFVGGDPLQDLLEAEQEVDASYHTDFEGVFALTDVSEITKQLKSVFAGYGCDHNHLDSLMENHQEAVERLAALNRQLLDSTSELAVKQTGVLQNVASEAMKTLQSFTQGWVRPEGVVKQAELSMQAIDNTLSHFRSLTNSVAEISKPRPTVMPDHKDLHGAVVKAYAGKSLQELTQAPVSAIKGISEALGNQLQEAFGIYTIRDMATNKFAEWASGTVLLADSDEGQVKRTARSSRKKAQDGADTSSPPETVADTPINQLRGIGERQVKLLQDAFRIHTVRELANNRFFSIARAIVMLADVEQ
jgi:hypothetical protein